MANDLARRIPFPDPAQVGYISWMERTIERQSKTIRALKVKQEEIITSILVLSEYTKGRTIIKDGKLRRFDGLRIEPLNTEPLGEGTDA